MSVESYRLKRAVRWDRVKEVLVGGGRAGTATGAGARVDRWSPEWAEKSAMNWLWS